MPKRIENVMIFFKLMSWLNLPFWTLLHFSSHFSYLLTVTIIHSLWMQAVWLVFHCKHSTSTPAAEQSPADRLYCQTSSQVGYTIQYSIREGYGGFFHFLHLYIYILLNKTWRKYFQLFLRLNILQLAHKDRTCFVISSPCLAFTTNLVKWMYPEEYVC